MKLRMTDLEFSFSREFAAAIPDAYQRLLLDVFQGDASLFARSDEVECAWSIIDPILAAWQSPAAPPLEAYPKGQWGPTYSDEWMHAHNAFHAATMCACGSPRLVEIAATLGESAALYRYYSQRYDHGKRDVAGEHRAIFEATIARDADLACRLHAEHIQRTAGIVIHALSEVQLQENPA